MNADCIAERYNGDLTDAATARCRERIHWICGAVRGTRVLDIGCSQGVVPLILAREGFDCVGIDIEAAGIEYACREAEKETEGVRRRLSFQIADATALPFESGRFDTVILGEVIEHFAQPERALAEAQRVLKPGGTLIVTVPLGLRHYHPDHKQVFYPASLLRTLEPYAHTTSIGTCNTFITYTGTKNGAEGGGAAATHLRLARELETFCADREMAILQLRADVKKLRAERRDARRIRSEQRLELAVLDRTLRAETAARAKVEQQAAALRQQLTAREAELASLRKRSAQQLQDAAREAEAVRQTLTARVEELNAALTARSDEAEQASAAWKQAEARLQGAAREAEAAREALAVRVEVLDAALAARSDELERTSAAWRQTEARLQDAAREANAARQMLAARVEELEAVLGARSDELERVSAALRDTEARLRQQEARLEQREREYSAQEAARTAELRDAKARLTARVARARSDADALLEVSRIRQIARIALPAGSRVLVVSKGDDRLLELDGRSGMHFPQMADGQYAGHHPGNSAEAIAHLEALKEAGARYFLLPASAFWWLDFYEEFAQHLASHYRVASYDEASGIIYALEGARGRSPQVGTRVARRLSAPPAAAVTTTGTSRPRPSARAAARVTPAAPPQPTAMTAAERDERAHYRHATRSAHFLGDATLLDGAAPSDAVLPLTADPRVLEVDVHSAYDVNIGVRLSSDAVAGAEEAAVVSIAYLDAHGAEISFDHADLERSPDLGAHKRLPPAHERQFVAFRAFPPPGAERMRLSFHAPEGSRQLQIANAVVAAVQRRGLSVVVGVHLAEETIGDLLRSLAAQTLAREHFEVIFVINGPRDRSADLITAWSAAHPEIQVRTCFEELASLGHARNQGIARARYSHVTFVDADDTISPGYLADFHDRLSANTVAVSHIADVHEDGRIDHDNAANAQLAAALARTDAIAAQDITALSTMSACKAIPSYFCRQTPFIAALRSGVEVSFYADLYSRCPVIFRAPRAPDACVYFRAVRQGSMSRKGPSFQFSVEDRLATITTLNRCLTRKLSPQQAAFIRSKVNAQADFMARYLYEAPAHFARYRETVASRNLLYFPWERVNRGAAGRIVFSYCFPPAGGASSIGAAKRIVEMQEPCDVICNDMSAVRTSDARLLELVKPFIGYLEQTDAPVNFGNWRAMTRFADAAVERAAACERAKGKPYRRMYSRAQWPASHVAAALFKVTRPALEWTAEFSDPLLLDVNGRERPGVCDGTWLADRGVYEAIRERGFTIDPAESRLFYLCELLAYTLADRIIFTNRTQMDYMLAYCGDPAIRQAVLAKADIRPHPVPHEWVRSGERTFHLDRTRTNLAYFGSIYANRSLGLLLDTLAALGSEERERLRLYVFTGQTAAMHEEVEARQLWDVVIVLPEREYCDFLRALDDFDVLIVNDAQKKAGGELNPYLPSKLSDYAASRTPILAIVEEGSELSRRSEPTYWCTLQERGPFVEQMAGVLRRIMDQTRVAGGALPAPDVEEPAPRPALAGLESRDIASSVEYGRWLERLRDAARTALPQEARLLVVSKGDERLLALDGCWSSHFPQTSGGEYLGHHPRDSEEAISHLEDLRAKGAEFLLVPSTAFWWLDFYGAFREHLDTKYRLVLSDPETCLVFSLREPAVFDEPRETPAVARVTPRPVPERVVVAGSLALKPHVGGHTWQFLQYLLGFRRLGWDVLFLDRLEPGMCVDEAGRPCPVEQSANVRYFREVMERFGFGDAYSLAYDGGARVFGLQKREVVEWTRHAAFLLNVMGYLVDEDILGSAGRRVFLDTDPSIGQMWRELGLADLFRGHDAYVTIGENIGRPDCSIPTCGLPWVRFRQPVVLEEWPVTPAPSGGCFTSIATWRGTYAPIEFRGRTYGQRVHQFRRFATVPARTGRPFTLALDIDPGDQRDVALLEDNAWALAPPRAVAGTPASYRSFIQQSRAEFMVAKSIVVDTKSGWFSDRSSCYLASGRPVLAQDTGLSGLYPVGRGLLTFATLDEAIAGVEDICGRYDEHARAAREIAHACFDSDKVLTELVQGVA